MASINTIRVVFAHTRVASLRSNVIAAGHVKHVPILHRRAYAKKRIKNKEDVQAYNRFEKSLRLSRVVFQNELKAQQASLEDYTAKAAEEARFEKEAEDEALEANKIELERMEKKRERAVASAEKKHLERLNRGAHAREKWEQDRVNARTSEVCQVQRESESFITMENLDQKIQEVIKNEMDYDFALSRKNGEKITSRNHYRTTSKIL